MKNISSMVQVVQSVMIGNKNFRKMVLMLAAIVVFVVTYLLILPAISIDKEEAATQGGIDVVAQEEVQASEEQAEKAEQEEPAENADQEKTTEKADSEKAEAEADQKKAEAKADQEKADAKAEQKEATEKTDQKETDEKSSEGKLLTKKTELTAEGDGYTVSAVVDKAGKVPATVELSTEELDKDHEDYDSLYKEAKKALKKESKGTEKIKSIRFYDISLQADGEAVEPSSAVSVTIAYDKAVKIANADNLRVIHFGKEKTEVLSAEATMEDKKMTETTFETESFSEFAVVEVESITVDYLSADGSTYKVSVNYGKDAGVPEGATLKVSEVTKKSSRYEGYVKQTAEKLDTRVIDFDYIKLLDIEILDANGDKVTLDAPVDVQIKLLDKEQAEETTQVVHFEGEKETPVVVDSIINGDVVSFSTDGFSIYAVVDEGDTGDYARMNLHFMNGTTEVGMMIVKNGDTREELNTIIYDPGVGTIPDGTIFKGWSKTAAYTVDDAESGMDIDEVRDWVDDLTIEENEDRYVYAMLYKNYVINYLDENNVGVGSDNVFMLSTETSSSYTVNMGYTPKDDTHGFLGWNVAEGGNNIAGHTTGTLYANGTDITISGNVTFSVNAPEGHWFVFDENGKGGTYNAPVFLETTDVTSRPVADSAMTRFGYTFGGWYDTKEHADAHGANPSVTTGAFQFGNTISDRTTIYASWIPVSTANYTVLIWKQNLAGDGYDFEEAINLTGNTGRTVNTVTQQGTGNNAYARVNGVNKQYTGFHLKEFTQNVTIVPEGTAVVNVYYDRNAYTFTFRAGRNHQFDWNNGVGTSRNPINIYTVTKLYDQDISDIWSFTGSDGYTYPETNAVTSWQPSGSSTYTARITRLERMPAENITFTLVHTQNTTRYFHYYIETVDGESGTRTYAGRQYNLYTDLDNDFNIVYYNDDFWELKGFTRQAITKASTNGTNYVVNLSAGGTYRWDGYWTSGWNPRYVSGLNDLDGQDNHLYFYYTRNRYSINYMDGVYVDGNGNPIDEANRNQLSEVDNLYYESNLTSYNKGGTNYYKPTYPGYEFEGWYLDEACTQPYTFTTMPLDGITVYAKWRQIQYRVFLHPNADDIADLNWGSESQSMNYRVAIGGTVSTPTGRSAEWEFVGWYTDPSCAPQYLFSSDTVLNEDTVTAAYNKSTDLTDVMDKWGNGATYNSDLTGWDDDNDPSTPGKDRFWITKKFELYGKWRAKLVGANGIGVIYYAGEGSNAPTDSNKYLDQAQATAQAASTAPPGKQFVKWIVQTWSTTENKYIDTEQSVYPGDSFNVLKENAKYVITGYANPDDPEDISTTQDATHTEIVATYTVQLRAEYIDTGAGVPTYVNWYANNETASSATSGFVVADENVMINQAIDIKPADTFSYVGHKFLGWARVPTTDAEGTELDPSLESQLNGKNLTLEQLGVADLFLKYDETTGKYVATSVTTGATPGNTVSKVAPDEREPHHAMVAVWEVKPYTVTIVKEIGDEDANKDVDKYDAFSFTAQFGSDEVQNFTLNGVTETVTPEGGTETQYVSTREFKNINYDTTFTVSENAPNYDYTVSATVMRDGETEAETLTPDENGKYKVLGDVTITYTNIRKTGTLVINKATNPTGIADSKKYEVSVKNSAGKYLQSVDSVNFGDDEKWLEVSVNEPITIENIPIDNYTITENTASEKVDIDGYRYDGETYSIAGTVAVTRGGTTELTVTNSYTKLVDVMVTKVLDDDYPLGATAFTFTPTLTDGETDVTSQYITELTDGKFTLTPTESGLINKVKKAEITFHDLPVGSVLDIAETSNTKYTTKISVNGGEETESTTGSITIADGTNTVEFTNTRKTYVVDFKKTEIDGTTELANAKFTLTIDNGSTYINYLDDDLTLGTDNLQLAIGDYELTEIQAPEGYIITINKIHFHVAQDGTVTVDDTFFKDGTTKVATLEPGISENSKGTITIKNEPGQPLPMTGGSGTLPYTLGGFALIMAAALMYGFRKRRRERRFN